VRDGVIRKEHVTADEIRAVASLQGLVGVPRLLAGGEDWYEMSEYGLCLADRPALDQRQAYALIADLHRVIKAIHGRGIVHRDIKPENIMLDDGHPILIDFQWAGAGDTACDWRGTGIDAILPNLCFDHLIEWIEKEYRVAVDHSDLDMAALEAQICTAPATGVPMSYQQMAWPGGYKLKGERDCEARWAMMNADVAEQKVLDLGCNLGWFTLRSMAEGAARAVGLDRGQNIVACAAEVAALYGLEAEFTQCDLNHLSGQWLRENTGRKYWDIVYCLSVWMHVADKDNLMNVLRLITRRVLYFEALRVGEYGSSRDDQEWIDYLLMYFPNAEIVLLGHTERKRPLFEVRVC
jgi:2-polyprenyl-3-methyl-5-hydroxy-6-metoxy-1,4-benzoquinol methylase